MAVYTLSVWVVKKGREDEFAARWREMAGWTMEEASSTGSVKTPGTLLRDRDIPNRFVSFGLWDTLTAVQTWRANPGFGEHVARMGALLESSTPMTLDDVTIAPGALDTAGAREVDQAPDPLSNERSLVERLDALEVAVAVLQAAQPPAKSAASPPP